MNLKEFLNPTWKKLILLILFISIIFFTTTEDKCKTWGASTLMVYRPFAPVPETPIYEDTRLPQNVFFPWQLTFKQNWFCVEDMGVNKRMLYIDWGIGIIVWYLISCLVFSSYNKFRNK